MENLSNTIGYVGMEVEVSIGELWGNIAAVWVVAMRMRTKATPLGRRVWQIQRAVRQNRQQVLLVWGDFLCYALQ